MEIEEGEAASSSSAQHNFFHKWINLQKEDLSELLQTQNQTDLSDSLSQLIEKNVQHFKDYTEERSQLSHNRPSEFFAPSWLSSLENSLLWIAGCRPSLFIRLVYALITNDSQLTSGLSPSQLTLIDNLHRKTVKEEDKLTSRLASLQEEIADNPLTMIVKKASQIGELGFDSGKALDEHEKSMAKMMEKADKLRMNILKEVINILTPLQAVDFLVTSKKLHLCMHEWGKKRDEMH